MQYDGSARGPLLGIAATVLQLRCLKVCTMSHPQMSIVIPAYNESARIEATLARVMECVETQRWDAEVLVVDDGSTDDTSGDC